MSEAMKRDGLVYGMPEAEYHGDKSELSSSGMKLINEAPKLYEHEVLLGNREHKDSYDLGTLVHAKVLGVGWGEVVLDFKDWRTKAAQQARDEARAEGLIPVLTHELVKPNAIAEAVLADADARPLFEVEGESEVSGFATCPEMGVRLRVRFDRLTKAALVDLKTSASKARADAFAMTVFKFGYDLQGATYQEVYELITGERLPFKFVTVETRAPHLVAVGTLNEEYLEMGRSKSMKARQKYAACMEAGVWPGYPPGVHVIEPPLAAVYDFQDNYEQRLEMTF